MKKLFTPGPLNTSLSVKEAMLVDVGSRDRYFIDSVHFVRKGLLDIANADPNLYTTVIIQGSGSFAVESVISSAIKASDKLLILINGTYGERIRKIAETYNISHTNIQWPENEAVEPGQVEDVLANDPSITHVAWIHSETTTGLFNPVEEIAVVCKKYGKICILDAMSSFGAAQIDLVGSGIDFLVSSSNKCIQGVPGFAFVLANRKALEYAQGNCKTLSLDLFDQWKVLEASGQFRFTPPTLSLLAFRQAMIELQGEGGVLAREKRYKENNQAVRSGMIQMGFEPYLPENIQGHIITTFLFPSPQFNFELFYEKLNERNCVIYPGKLTKAETFRIGNIGHLFQEDMQYLLESIRSVLQEG